MRRQQTEQHRRTQILVLLGERSGGSGTVYGRNRFGQESCVYAEAEIICPFKDFKVTYCSSFAASREKKCLERNRNNRATRT